MTKVVPFEETILMTQGFQEKEAIQDVLTGRALR